MPASARRESNRNSGTEDVTPRPASPPTTQSRARSVSRCRPTSRAPRGARAPKTAKARTGREVRIPVSAVDIRRPALMSPRTGPTLTAVGRRLKASTTIPTTTRMRCARELRASVTRASCRRTLSAAATGSVRRLRGVGAGCQDLSMREVTDAQRRARLGARHALSRRAGSVAEAVEQMTCLHATEPASVYLSVVARADASRSDIDKALYEERSVVKQLAMRRTLFAFPRDLLPAVWGSASARVLDQLRTRLAKEVRVQRAGRRRSCLAGDHVRRGAPQPASRRVRPPRPSCASAFLTWRYGWSSPPARSTAAASRSPLGCWARSLSVGRSCVGRTTAVGTSRDHAGS